MLTRKFLGISIGIAITFAGMAPAGFAKKASEAVQSPAGTKSGAATNDSAKPSENGHESGEADEDLQEVAAVIERSNKLVNEGKFAAAIDVLRAGLKEHGQNPHLHERLSKVCYLNGSVDDAISELLMAISIDPNVFEYYSDVAWLYSISGKPREAVTYSKAAVLRDPNKAYPYVVMGFSLGCLGKKQLATDMLKKALELDPNNSTAHLYLADVMANSGDYEHALPLYQKSLKLGTQTSSAFVGLGDCFQKLGHTKEAIAAYRRAVDIAPQDANARGHLGFALSQSGEMLEGMRQGMTANSIRLGQYWGKFMGMFVAVWAGIFLVFGTVFGAMFMGSRFIPVAGETILNQFMMVIYKERPGRFVITDRRLVFVPEIVSRWFGATRVSIQRDQISSVKTDDTAGGGTVTINASSESDLVFRVPELVFGPLVAVLNEQKLIGDLSAADEDPVELTKATEPRVVKIPEKEEQSDTAQFEKYAVIAASFDFRDGKPEEPTLKLAAIPESAAQSLKEQAESSTALFPGHPKTKSDSEKKSKSDSPSKKDSKSDKKESNKDNKPALRPLAKLEPIPANKPEKESVKSDSKSASIEEPSVLEKAQALPKLNATGPAEKTDDEPEKKADKPQESESKTVTENPVNKENSGETQK